ncbi:signal peptide peptidase [Colletotrichum plurivorum]|uniref:Signal peptide peptidase n=1 Tax=Colletotrichum plurivorum TaxID=2175906 RepID=A0A8H6KUM4_9PEZI|nr:signal peptide peptidase [Colletotrichum plurivorum]
MASPSPGTPPFDEVAQNLTNGNLTSVMNATAGPFLDAQWDVAKIASFLTMEAKLIFGALAIIWIGAHGSLRRPPSAAPAKPKKGAKRDRKEDEPITEGLMPSDAIMFPLLAGVMLIGLYYLIQWLQDPAILNKILRGYMSLMGVASLTTLLAHSLKVASGFVFPNWFRENGFLCRVDDDRESFLKIEGREADDDAEGEVLPRASPLPPALRSLVPLRSPSRFLWDLRHLLVDEWTIRAKVHGLFREKLHLSVNHIVGFFLAIATVSAYYLTSSPLLSNLIGYGFCYGSFLIMSPTSFATGSLVLMGLFFYDIVMVFYTPYMITVATKLDVPIKLQFKTAARSSILGLGDIVVPGIVMCLALRFDLWRHYQSKIKRLETNLKSDERDASSGEVVTVSQTKTLAEKALWLDINGCWGDWFWSSSWLGLFKSGGAPAPPSVRGSTFRKTYFNASLAGYTVGMLVTLAMLHIFKHGQPALLYLVPGVLGSLWLTGLVRGELKDMWTYTEDGSLDTRDVVVEVDGNGNVIKEVKKDGDKDEEKKKKAEEEQAAKEKKLAEAKEDEKEAERSEYSIVSFSITAPLRKQKAN